MLLAESDEELRRMVAYVLAEDGFDVVEAANAAEFQSNVASMVRADSTEASFDLVISEIRFPGFRGFDLLSELRRVPKAPPVILVTAFGSAHTHSTARDLGAALVLNKPFDLDNLRDAAASLTGVDFFAHAPPAM